MLRASFETLLSTFHVNVQFSAEEGTTTVLLGESGAGKSTVLRLIAGLLKADRGHFSLKDVIYFDSERQIMVPAYERPFGYVFQDYVLFPHLTVFENVAFGLRAQHLPSRIVRQWVGEALEQVRLGGLEQRRQAQLSGGQQQRVAIARALALHPQLLLLDEPLSALDVQTRREVRQELYYLLTSLNITTILVTHQYMEALLFGDQILVLEQGQVHQQGTQQTLAQNPRSSYVAELVGTNFFRGRIIHREGQRLCTIQLPGSQEPRIEIQAVLEESGNQERTPAIGEEAYAVVDPHSITIHRMFPEGSARNVFMGEILQIVHMGTAQGNDGPVRLSLRLDPSTVPLIAEVTTGSVTHMQLKEGKTVYATFKATEARAYT